MGFYKPKKFKCGNAVVLITTIMKRHFLIWFGFSGYFPTHISATKSAVPARKHFSKYTTFTTLCPTHLCGLKLFPPKVLYLQNKAITLILSFLIGKIVLPDILHAFFKKSKLHSVILTKQLAGLYSQSCSSHIGYIRCIINMSFKRLS